MGSGPAVALLQEDLAAALEGGGDLLLAAVEAPGQIAVVQRPVEDVAAGEFPGRIAEGVAVRVHAVGGLEDRRLVRGEEASISASCQR